MATAIVSGRVDEQVKNRASAYIRAAGLTVGDVIKITWENIARTGEVPVATVEERDEKSAQSPMDVFLELREEMNALTAQDEWLATLTDKQMRDMITDHLMEKYGY